MKRQERIYRNYGIAEILGVDLDKSIDRKMKINEERVYTQENGVLKRK